MSDTPTGNGNGNGNGDAGDQSSGGDRPTTNWEAEGRVFDRMRSRPTSGPTEEDRRAEQERNRSQAEAERQHAADVNAAAALREAEGASRGPAEVEVQVPRVEDIDPRAERRAEQQVAGCFLAGALGAIGFTIVYFAVNPQDTAYTPGLGISLAVMLVGLGAGPVVWAKKLMGDEEAVQEREPFASPPEEAAATGAALKEGFEQTGLQRRGLIKASIAVAGTFAALPAVVPLLSMGNWRHKERALANTPWKKGVRLVRENGSPVRVGDLEYGGVLTVLPEGNLGTSDGPTLLIRLRPGENRADDAYYTYDDYVAYSMICTHAGCPVKLYEQQTHHLLCPCHQSTFLVTEGCKVIFGPAARPLPQLPITVDEEGFFVAKRDYNEPIGPSYWERPTGEFTTGNA